MEGIKKEIPLPKILLLLLIATVSGQVPLHKVTVVVHCVLIEVMGCAVMCCGFDGESGV